MNEKIRQLEKEILAELKKIEECKHVMDKPFYSPEIGYWVRRCKFCGYEQHTITENPVFVEHEPTF